MSIARYFRVFCIAVFFAAFAAASLPAQSGSGMSLNGATGLYSIPSGRIGWEHGGHSAFGLDFGFHTIMSGGEANSIPKFALSLFNFLEISGAFDIRPEDSRGNDFIGGVKLQIPLTRTALAFGGNYQSFRMQNFTDNYRDHFAWQIYAAVTFAGSFFNMPAETTIVFGRTFIEGYSNSNIDFGMGFELLLFPNVFENLVSWITDFANFSYSAYPFLADAWHRGVLNTGLRFNLSTIPAFTRFRFFADIMLVDAFDHNRAFSAGFTFGIPIL